jgi:hypothetical protein
MEIITADPLISGYRIIPPPPQSSSNNTTTRIPSSQSQDTVWYEFTERVQYNPGKGKPSTGMLKYTSSFTNTPIGLRTQTRAPAGVLIRIKYLITETNPAMAGTSAFRDTFIGTESLFIVPGLHLRADIEIDGSSANAERVRTQCRAVIREVVDRMAHQAQSATLKNRRRSVQLRMNTIDSIKPSGAGGRAASPFEIPKRASSQAPMLVAQQRQLLNAVGVRTPSPANRSPLATMRRHSSVYGANGKLTLSAITPSGPELDYPAQPKSACDVRASWPRRISTGAYISELSAERASRVISTISTASSESLNVASAASSTPSPRSSAGSSPAITPCTEISSPGEDPAKSKTSSLPCGSSSDENGNLALPSSPQPSPSPTKTLSLPPSPIRPPPPPPLSAQQQNARMSLSKLITMTSPRAASPLGEKLPIQRPSIPKRPKTALDLAAFALAGQGSIRRRTETVSKPRNVGRKRRAEAAAAAIAESKKVEEKDTFPKSEMVEDKENLPPSLRIGRPASTGMMAVNVNVDYLHLERLSCGVVGLGITA